MAGKIAFIVAPLFIQVVGETRQIWWQLRAERGKDAEASNVEDLSQV